ncbi:hypothetical protein [Streptomyces achromogenes]|uniref:hypothetical protein n=1 Tax=Streptomyces achromogenes TaxID=67255 RepID=UPI00358E1B29
MSYAYDLRHLWRFFGERGLTWDAFAPPHAIPLLEYLRSVPSRRPRQRMTLTTVTTAADGPATKLAATTVNRILAAVSSFYEYAILAGLLDRTNPIEKRPDPALQLFPTGTARSWAGPAASAQYAAQSGSRPSRPYPGHWTTPRLRPCSPRCGQHVTGRWCC